MNDLAKTVNAWQGAAILEYLSSSHVGKSAQGERGYGGEAMGEEMRKGGGKIHGGTMALVGWSGAAYGDQSTMGKCRLGYVIGLTSSPVRGPRRIIQSTSKFPRKPVRGS